MCTTCGCSDGATTTITDPATGEHRHVLADGTVVTHTHHHHDHDHDHDHGHGVERLEAAVLAKNDQFADRNRAWFDAREVVAINLMSSPGAGKTTLLVRTLSELGGDTAVIEGDQASTLDADRILATGSPVVQVNTGTGCHLEADMVWNGVQKLRPAVGATVFIENVGNLVCPALFDLGESAKVVLFSTTEGEDKPTKYPHMFRAADLVLLTKIDLEPHLDFDVERALAAVKELNPDAPILKVSAKSGEGLEAWYGWLRERGGRLPQASK